MANHHVAEFDNMVVRFAVDNHTVELGDTSAVKIRGTRRLAVTSAGRALFVDGSVERSGPDRVEEGGPLLLVDRQ